MFKVFCAYCDKAVDQRPLERPRVWPTVCHEHSRCNDRFQIICDDCYNERIRGKARPFLMEKKDER